MQLIPQNTSLFPSDFETWYSSSAGRASALLRKPLCAFGTSWMRQYQSPCQSLHWALVTHGNNRTSFYLLRRMQVGHLYCLLQNFGISHKVSPLLCTHTSNVERGCTFSYKVPEAQLACLGETVKVLYSNSSNTVQNLSNLCCISGSGQNILSSCSSPGGN